MLKSIGFFAGAGVPLLGAQWAGIQPEAHYEVRPFFNIDTFKENFPGVEIYDDIEDIRPVDIKDRHIIIGNPSCNVFSTLSTRKKHKVTSETFSKTELFICLNKVSVLRPGFFIIENLPRSKKYLDIGKNYIRVKGTDIELNFKRYHITSKVLNSFNFGVAQKRKRLFIIGSKHGPLDITESRTSTPYRVGETVEEAFIGINPEDPNHVYPNHSAKRIEGFDALKPGDSYYGTQNNRRLFLHKPSGVVTSSCSRAVHPTEPRTLTVRETARLMGYPDSFKFFGPETSQLDQVGKAIVPQIIYSICLDIKMAFPYVN